MRHLIIAFSSFLYTGYFPVASGTFATLCFVPVYYFIFKDMHPVLYLAITLVIIFAGIWASSYAAAVYKKDDPSKVVIDEVAGFLVTMMFIKYTPARLIIGFFASRIFDIIKLPPARQSEKLHGGTGIMLDDVVAGIQANIFMWIVIYFKADVALAGLLSRLA